MSFVLHLSSGGAHHILMNLPNFFSHHLTMILSVRCSKAFIFSFSTQPSKHRVPGKARKRVGVSVITLWQGMAEVHDDDRTALPHKKGNPTVGKVYCSDHPDIVIERKKFRTKNVEVPCWECIQVSKKVSFDSRHAGTPVKICPLNEPLDIPPPIHIG